MCLIDLTHLASLCILSTSSYSFFSPVSTLSTCSLRERACFKSRVLFFGPSWISVALFSKVFMCEASASHCFSNTYLQSKQYWFNSPFSWHTSNSKNVKNKTKEYFTHSGLVEFNSEALWAAEVQVPLHRWACLVNKLVHCLLLAVKLLPGCQCDLRMTMPRNHWYPINFIWHSLITTSYLVRWLPN